MDLEQQLKAYCEIIHPDTALLTPEQFTIIRRQGIGASDSSVILGVNPFKTTAQLLTEKLIKEGVTDEEVEIGQKATVRMGRELEPFILEKVNLALPGAEICKPAPMYRLKAAPFIIINYDAIAEIVGGYIPLEIKTISMYGDKYYDKEKAILPEEVLNWKHPKITPIGTLEERAAACGIPVYYYTQVQQQMLPLHAQYGILAALHVKDWTLRFYFVPCDVETQASIVFEGGKFWNKVEKLRC